MKKVFSVIVLAVLFLSLKLNAQVGIGTTDPKPESILDIESSDKGILIPRVSIPDLNNLSPITTASATESLLVFNTNEFTGKGFYYWNGTDQWFPVGGEAFYAGLTLGMQYYFYDLPTGTTPDIRDINMNTEITHSGYYNGSLNSAGLSSLTPTGSETENFILKIIGFYTVPVQGIYNFFCTANDGIRIFVDNSLVVDEWTDGDDGTATGSVQLSKGKHKFEIWYYNNGTGESASFDVQWGSGGGTIEASTFTID